jgi:hypothetical protein
MFVLVTRPALWTRLTCAADGGLPAKELSMHLPIDRKCHPQIADARVLEWGEISRVMSREGTSAAARLLMIALYGWQWQLCLLQNQNSGIA